MISLEECPELSHCVAGTASQHGESQSTTVYVLREEMHFLCLTLRNQETLRHSCSLHFFFPSLKELPLGQFFFVVVLFFFLFLNQRSKRSDIKQSVVHQGVILVPTHLGFLCPSWISVPAFIPLFSSPSCFRRLRVQISGPLVHSPLGRIQNRLEGSSGPLPLPSPQSHTLKPPPCNLKGNLFCNISSSFQLFKNLIL